MQQYSIFFNHIPYSNQTLNEYKKTHPKRIYRSYTNPYKTDLDLNIYSGSYYCVNHGHDIGEVYIEVVDMIDGLKKTILVSHCKDCDKFFLAQNALEKYHKSGVCPRARFLLPYSGSTFNEFNEKSILKLYGYTVGVNGMSLSQRQTLLKTLITQGIVPRYKVIDQLNFDIDVLGRRECMEQSKADWRADLQFVYQLVLAG